MVTPNDPDNLANAPPPGDRPADPKMSGQEQPERWTVCKCGHVHWGANDAAGFVFRHLPPQGDPVYLLQRRSRQVDYGGTWGIPAGAIKWGEDLEMAGRRELQEEIGFLPLYRVMGLII
jgi:hypothetical protein